MKSQRVRGKSWGECPRKAEARKVSIVDTYQRVFGSSAVPSHRQYWALCGQLFSRSGELAVGSELEQLIGHGFLSEGQFHGVERDHETYAINRMVVAAAGREMHLHYGDIVDALDLEFGMGTLDPAVVNLDTTTWPDSSARLLGRVMGVLNHVDGPTMVVWNTLKRNRLFGRSYSWADVRQAVVNDPVVGQAIDVGGWRQATSLVYEYDGTGRSSSTMGTIVLVREGWGVPLPQGWEAEPGLVSSEDGRGEAEVIEGLAETGRIGLDPRGFG